MTQRQIVLPPPHADQLRVWQAGRRFTALRCGRRWGKTQLAISITAQHAAHGQSWGMFAPDYKILSETYRELEHVLAPLITASSKMDGLIRLVGGGRIDFWTLNNPQAGRSRKYHGVVIDEAAFAGEDMADIWAKSISPTLLDYKGAAWAMSTPHGLAEDNWFYRICTDAGAGWTELHAPTAANPYMDGEEIERLRVACHPDVFRQEYLAEFVDWRGLAFFAEDKLLENGQPVDDVPKVDQVFAVVDTALKDGLEHDGTAVLYCGKLKIGGPRLYLLDWDVLSIEGASLQAWLPSVQVRLEQLSAQYRAREGNLGAYIEDKGSGTVLLQQLRNRGGPAYPLPEELVALGKEGRALNVSAYVHQGLVQLSRPALEKVTSFHGLTRNHLLAQVCGFRLGNKTPHGMDLLDCFTYAVAIALGNQRGY